MRFVETAALRAFAVLAFVLLALAGLAYLAVSTPARFATTLRGNTKVRAKRASNRPELLGENA